MATKYITLFCIFLFLGKVKAQSSEFLIKLDSAYIYYDSLNYNKSKIFFLDLIKYDEVKRKDYYHLASCYSMLNQIDSGFIYLDKAIEYGLNYQDTNMISEDVKIMNLIKSREFGFRKKNLINNLNQISAIDSTWQKYFLNLRERDQKYRKFTPNIDAEMWKEQEILDKENQLALDTFIQKFGWPRISIFGEDVARIAWLIAQHADKNLTFQYKCLNLMKKLFRYNEIALGNYAYLIDRVLINDCKEQLYGTQFSIIMDEKENFKSIEFKPISESHLVDKRRRYMNLPSLDFYRKTAKERYEK